MQMLGVFGSMLGPIGAGLSYFEDMKQLKQQQRIADLNFQAQMQASEQQQQLFEFQFQQNQRIYEQQKAAQMANANAMRAQAETNDKNTRRDAASTRDDYERMKAIQRARLAKSGVLEAGTPLDLLAETAGQMELAVANKVYESGIESSKLKYQAQGEESNASITGLSAAIQGFKDQAGIAEARNQMYHAKIENLVTTNAIKQQKQKALSGLLESLGQQGQQSNRDWQAGAYDSSKRKGSLY